MLFKVFIKSSNVLKAFGFHSQTNLFELDFFMRKKSWRWSNQCQGGQNCCVMVTQFVLVLPIVGILVHCRSTLSLLPGCYALHCMPWAKPQNMSQGGARQYKWELSFSLTHLHLLTCTSPFTSLLSYWFI